MSNFLLLIMQSQILCQILFLFQYLSVKIEIPTELIAIQKIIFFLKKSSLKPFYIEK